MQEKHSRADSSVAPVEPEWPHPDDVRRELNRIINSSSFRDAYRLTSFLSFIVEMTLMGHSKKLKAYTIAVEALDRGADFDPQVDPIVRVEAVRLRQALARYYSGAGRDDPLLIEVSRGSYVPAFRHRNASDRHKPGAAAPPRAAAQAEATVGGDRRPTPGAFARGQAVSRAYQSLPPTGRRDGGGRRRNAANADRFAGPSGRLRAARPCLRR